MVPWVGLVRLVNDAVAAVTGVIPGLALGGACLGLLEEYQAFRGADKVLFDDGAGGVRSGIVEEELVKLGADLAVVAAACGVGCGLGVEANPCGVEVVGAFGQDGADPAGRACLRGQLVIVDRNGGGEAAHGVAGNADDAVAVSVLEDVGLLVHVVHGVILGIGPEGHPVAVFLGRAGVAVVILVERQHHDAAAGHLDGGLVLHLGTVQVAVGGHDGGVRVGGVHALGHVQQARKGAGVGIKGNAGDLDLVE